MRTLFRSAQAIVLALVISGLSATPAAANTLLAFEVLMNGAQQNPPVASPSTGVALVLLDKTTNNVCYRISYTPLGGTELLAHFHGPAAPGQDAPVLVNITPSPSPVGSPKHGCVLFAKDQVKMLTKGLMYINVHTSIAPNGEIRGQVLPTKVKYTKVPALASPSGAFVD